MGEGERGRRDEGRATERGEQWVAMGVPSVQNVVVMRHGDRIDSFEPLWMAHAQRPWDPPLTQDGKTRAWMTGKRLRAAHLGFPIHRVVVSPFLRCLQTAREVVSALCVTTADEDALLAAESSRDFPMDTSSLKVSIELGLCEIICSQTIRNESHPKDGVWFPEVSQLEIVFPAGTVDHSVERIYQELPHWEEPLAEARERYQNVILALADKYPNENLLLVTHGEGVGVSVSAFMERVEIFEVEFCAYSLLQRKLSFKDPRTFTAEPFKVLTEIGETGIRFYSTQ